MQNNTHSIPRSFIPCVKDDGSPLVPGGEVFAIGWNSYKNRPVFSFNPSTLDAAALALEWLNSHLDERLDSYSDTNDFINALRSVLTSDCDCSPGRNRDRIINCTTYVESVSTLNLSFGGGSHV